jgi:phospholipase C
MRFPSLLIAGALLTAPATAGPIKHVVLLMFENHSFDNMLGWLTRNNSQVKGLVGNESNPLDPQNPSSPRVVVTDRGAYSDPDPDHSVPATTLQIYGTQLNADVEHNPADILMDGFVAAYAKHGSNGSIIMDCFKPEAVPVISTLAMEFALFDEYFAGVPGPTFPNRLFGMSATSDG